jgi:hypothetical protein
MNAINIIFDGPPAPESGRFVEVETDDGKSISVGEWVERPDGLWSLRIEPDAELQAKLAASVEEGKVDYRMRREAEARLAKVEELMMATADEFGGMQCSIKLTDIKEALK